MIRNFALALSAVCVAAVALGDDAVAQQTRALSPHQEADAVGPLSGETGEALLHRLVRDSEGRSLGAVISVALGVGGRIDAIIIDVGPHLSASSREVAIPYSELDIQPKRPVTVLMTAPELAALPEYRYADPAQRGSAFRSMSVQTSPLA